MNSQFRELSSLVLFVTYKKFKRNFNNVLGNDFCATDNTPPVFGGIYLDPLLK